MPATLNARPKPCQPQRWLDRVDRHRVDIVLLDPSTDEALVRALDENPVWTSTDRLPELVIYRRQSTLNTKSGNDFAA